MSFVKPFKDCVIHIIVNKDNTLSGLTDKVAHKSVCIKYLTVIEYSLHGDGFLFFKSLQHLVYSFIRLILMLLKGELIIFNGVQPLEYPGVGGKETTHSGKSFHDTDAYRYGSLAF